MPPFLQEPFQQKRKKIRECIELAAPSHVFVPELDTIVDILVRRPFYEVSQRSGGSVVSLDLHRDQAVLVTDKEIHLKRRTVLLEVIKLLISRLAEHLANDVLVYGALVRPEVLVCT